MKRAIFAGLILVLCACIGAFGERVHEDVHQTIAAGATPVVHVENIAGTVRIAGWAKPSVDMMATKYGYDTQELRGIDIGVHRSGDGIFIETTYTSGNNNAGVRYRIFVPQGASVQVGNVAGAVTIDGVQGNVSVHTQAGTIDARLGRVDGGRSVDLRATTGAIALRIAPQSGASVDAQSTVGDFSSDFPSISKTRDNLVGARASGTIGSGSARIKLSTTTGAISLLTAQ